MDHGAHDHRTGDGGPPGSATEVTLGNEHAALAGPGVATGAAHHRHEGHSVAMFRDKFRLSLPLTVPVVIDVMWLRWACRPDRRVSARLGLHR